MQRIEGCYGAFTRVKLNKLIMKREKNMNKLSWVLIESILAGLGFGYALLGYLTHYSFVNVERSFALTIAVSFAFGVIMSLIVIGMSGSGSR